MHVKPVEKKNRVILVDGDCTTRYEITRSRALLTQSVDFALHKTAVKVIIAAYLNAEMATV